MTSRFLCNHFRKKSHSLLKVKKIRPVFDTIWIQAVATHIWVSFLRTGLGPELCHLKKSLKSCCDQTRRANFVFGWFHVKTRRKKVNVKKIHFYEEIWKNIGYFYAFCHFWHHLVFGTVLDFFCLNSQNRTIFKKWILKN